MGYALERMKSRRAIVVGGSLGGLFAATIDFLIPIYCYYKLTGATKISLVFFGSLTVIGYFSVVVTIYQMVYGLDVMPRWIRI